MSDKEIIEEQLKKFGESREEFFKLLDSLVPRLTNTDVFDFENCEDKNLKEIYAKFYSYDYAIRRILPFVYKAYDIKFSV
ncbi:MAG: hypothetical protein GX282_00960 [Campylobacteraceae bacterium]|nr:hypothetical protein [Campylobacteraceae bacterium]